jgi:hypothetical protein
MKKNESAKRTERAPVLSGQTYVLQATLWYEQDRTEHVAPSTYVWASFWVHSMVRTSRPTKAL